MTTLTTTEPVSKFSLTIADFKANNVDMIWQQECIFNGELTPVKYKVIVDDEYKLKLTLSFPDLGESLTMNLTDIHEEYPENDNGETHYEDQMGSFIVNVKLTDEVIYFTIYK